jgi:hypothetical protein
MRYPAIYYNVGIVLIFLARVVLYTRQEPFFRLCGNPILAVEFFQTFKTQIGLGAQDLNGTHQDPLTQQQG